MSTRVQNILSIATLAMSLIIAALPAKTENAAALESTQLVAAQSN